jgi:hypothetical protein
MTKDDILNILVELRDCLNEFNRIKYERTPEQKELHNKISELYGSIQEYYLEVTGLLNIEVPIDNNGLKSTYNNFFEAGYLSGRTIHSHQGYTELIKVIGVIKSKTFNQKKVIEKRGNSFSRIEILTASSVFIVLLGGAFLFGKYIGENRFDQKKIDLTGENTTLKIDTSSLSETIRKYEDSISKLHIKCEEIPIITEPIESVKKVTISYLEPVSIFEGEVLITADSFYKELTFKGVKGVDENLNGEYKNNKIKVAEGDRFFIKLESGEIWIANVFDLVNGIDLEIFKRKNSS